MMAVRGARRIARCAGRKLKFDDLLQAISPADDIAPAALNRICIHEAAHAVVSLAVRSGFLKRCIVGSTASSAGRTLIQMDTDDLLTRDSVERRAVVLLAGRTAEQNSDRQRRARRRWGRRIGPRPGHSVRRDAARLHGPRRHADLRHLV